MSSLHRTSETRSAGQEILVVFTTIIIIIIIILDDDDFVKTGVRAGKPKVASLAGGLGYEVTAEEVDAAFALKDAGQE